MRISEEAFQEILRNGVKVNDAISVDKTGDRPGSAAHPLSSSAGRAALPPVTLERRALTKGEKAPLEHDEQVALFSWAKEYEKQYPPLQLLYAIPNGGYRHRATAVNLKAEGVKAGVPDCFLPVVCTAKDGVVYHGLYIELKRADRKNHPTSEQLVWISRLRAEGYRVEVCYGANDAVRVIIDYLGIR